MMAMNAESIGIILPAGNLVFLCPGELVNPKFNVESNPAEVDAGRIANST
jgi:hypothetical protein